MALYYDYDSSFLYKDKKDVSKLFDIFSADNQLTIGLFVPTHRNERVKYPGADELLTKENHLHEFMLQLPDLSRDCYCKVIY